MGKKANEGWSLVKIVLALIGLVFVVLIIYIVGKNLVKIIDKIF